MICKYQINRLNKYLCGKPDYDSKNHLWIIYAGNLGFVVVISEETGRIKIYNSGIGIDGIPVSYIGTIEGQDRSWGKNLCKEIIRLVYDYFN